MAARLHRPAGPRSARPRAGDPAPRRPGDVSIRNACLPGQPAVGPGDVVALQQRVGNRTVSAALARPSESSRGVESVQRDTTPRHGQRQAAPAETATRPAAVRSLGERLTEAAGAVQTMIALFLAGELVSRRSIVTWTGGDVAKRRAAKLAERLRGYTLEMTWYGRILDTMASAGTRIPHLVWKGVSMWFAFAAGLRNQRLQSVVRVPVRSGAIRESEVRAHRIGTATGAGMRGAVRVSGGIGVLSLAEDFQSIRERKVQVDLEGLSPGDFPVGHEFENVYLGTSRGGGAVYVDIRVKRNIVWRRKFYIVEFHELY